MNLSNHFVIYTDGSWRHGSDQDGNIDHDISAGGYAFMVRIPEKYKGQPEFIFRRGAINKGRFSHRFNNGKKGEHPVVISRDILSPAIMEMMAIQQGINYALSSIHQNYKPGMTIPRVWVYSDFKPLVDHLNDVIYRNAKLSVNLSKYKVFHSLISLIKRAPVEFFYVRAHNGHRENETMDMLANTACVDAFSRLQSMNLDEAIANELIKIEAEGMVVHEEDSDLPTMTMSDEGVEIDDVRDLSYKNNIDN